MKLLTIITHLCPASTPISGIRQLGWGWFHLMPIQFIVGWYLDSYEIPTLSNTYRTYADT
jgi:hypothetical protein